MSHLKPTTPSCRRRYWLSPFYRWGNWNSKVTWLAIGRTGTWPQAALFHCIGRLVKRFSDPLRTNGTLAFRSRFLWEGFDGLDYKLQDWTMRNIFRLNLCTVWGRWGIISGMISIYCLLCLVVIGQGERRRKWKVVGGKCLELIKNKGLDVGLKEVWSQMYSI